MKKTKKQLTVSINNNNCLVKPLTLKAVMDLEDVYGISFQNLTQGITTKQLVTILTVALQEANPDKNITEEMVLKLDFSHPLMKKEVLETIMGNSNQNPLE